MKQYLTIISVSKLQVCLPLLTVFDTFTRRTVACDTVGSMFDAGLAPVTTDELHVAPSSPRPLHHQADDNSFLHTTSNSSALGRTPQFC